MQAKMKAQVFYKPNDMRFEMLDIPQIAPHQCQLACSIFVGRSTQSIG
jgi:hypothetical protein